MLNIGPKQLSFHSLLYDKIPENHTLKNISKAVDFSFINELLASSYSRYYGRPAKEPEMMAKLLILQYLYNLSDERIIEEARLNLAYMWFIGINPEEELPDPSLLSKFRRQRLQETSLDEIITEVVRQCIENGLIKGTTVSIDATHTAANTTKKVPERLMKHIAKKILKSVEEETGSIPPDINSEIPAYKEIKDHKEAKETMKDYLESLIERVETNDEIKEKEKVKKAIIEAHEVLSDPKFIIQKGQRSLVDAEARVGHKSKTESFFGYKTEFIMIIEERIITAVTVESGEYVDGTKIDQLLEQTQKSGIKSTELYGDKAYFRYEIINKLIDQMIEPYIPVSRASYRIDEELFRYNKDSDEWFCVMGNNTISQKEKKGQKGGKETSCLEYVFDKTICQDCTNREECMGKSKTKARKLRVSINTAELYEISQKQKTEEFIEKYKNRAAHEWKNGEMKRFHGMDRARGYGLKSMATQAKLTALAVNLKRIAALVAAISNAFLLFEIPFRLIA